MLTPDPLDVRADYVEEVKGPKGAVDMSKYHNRIKELEEKEE